MEEYSITVRDLKIRYKSVQAYSIKKSLLRLKGVDTEAFEAVRGISFDVKQGEILGITGKNGAASLRCFVPWLIFFRRMKQYRSSWTFCFYCDR